MVINHGRAWLNVKQIYILEYSNICLFCYFKGAFNGQHHSRTHDVDLIFSEIAMKIRKSFYLRPI